ncbi:MAG: hypothetical protein WCH58_01095 [Candidatus Saccharibacteria bacterium]
MNEETLTDLKQFITTTVREEISGVNERIDGVNARITSLEVRVDERFDKIDERFDENDLKQNEILNAIGEVQELQNRAIRRQADAIDNHELRIVKLEKRTA